MPFSPTIQRSFAEHFVVTVRQPGFNDARVEVDVAEGDTEQVEVELEIDQDDDERGCGSCGCEHGLVCSPSDGRCYACVSDADCAMGGTCTVNRVCSYGATSGGFCEPCTSALDCGEVGAVCVNDTGAQLAGYCTSTCSDETGACPAGYECENGVCAVPMTCAQLAITFGAVCTEDRNCAAALHDGTCARSGASGAGYCTPPVQAGCPAGFEPDPAGSGYCARMP